MAQQATYAFGRPRRNLRCDVLALSVFARDYEPVPRPPVGALFEAGIDVGAELLANLRRIVTSEESRSFEPALPDLVRWLPPRG